MISRIAITTLGSLAAASSLLAQRSTLSVGVADAQTGAPIAGAEVLLPDQKRLARTDSLGQARVPGIPFGDHRVRVRLLGYAPGDAEIKFAGDTTGVVFRLEKSAQALGAIDVNAAGLPRGLKDFEMRRKQGLGRFMTESDLAPNANKDFMVLASTQFPGLTMRTDESGLVHLASTRSQCGGAEASVASTKRGVDRIGGKPGMRSQLGTREGFEDTGAGTCATEKPCLLQVYLDDIDLGETDAGLVRTWDLSGAEYYSGNTVPARYRRGSACGVMLLWSKWK
ncbi:MAG TPA: carboxypeptidase regulatory-like domain-containing protein [Gemmatimonadaceae bacterium]|nr:carboxypeptidase regulatory-like domain-containing protein [Gemmatimonadaceae bacterium]